MYLNAKITS